MKVKRNLLWQLPLLIIVTGPLWWSPVGDLLGPRGNFENTGGAKISRQSFTMERVVLTQNRGGHDELVIKADKVNSGIHEDLVHLEGIEARMQGRDGRPSVLRGGEAFYHAGQQIVTVLDNVRLKTPDGREMRTEALRYLTKFRKLKTAEDVWLGSEKIQIEGGNFFYDLDDGDFRVGGRVSVDFF
ncbi:MAG: LPS export ABC transporter periplasmic protein LptC [Thermodesulfobacteriota bacterium]